MEHETETPSHLDREAALLYFIRLEEIRSGCRPEQLSTADRFTHAGKFNFIIHDCPGRAFRIRVMTVHEAAAAGVPANDFGDVFTHRGHAWTVLDA